MAAAIISGIWLLAIWYSVLADSEDIELLRELEAKSLVERVNTANAGWRAEAYPKFARLSAEERRQFNGLRVKMQPEGKKKMDEEAEEEVAKLLMNNAEEQETDQGGEGEAEDEGVPRLPEQFNPAERWPECADVIVDIRDQSRCGSCWAVAAAGTLSDRICIKSGGRLKPSVSDIDTASCSMLGRDGCQGAPDLSPSWLYYQRQGVVTGSNFSLQAGCKPYPFPPSHQAKENYRTPLCVPQCQKAYQQKTYAGDKLFASAPIVLRAGGNKTMEQLLKQELYANGSVEVGFLVYTDFFYYRSGVYKQTWGVPEGGHAVRLVGWGVDTLTRMPFWLVANSWGRDWGEHGFFRIRRGTNEAEIEGMVDAYTAAVPGVQEQ